MLLAHSSPPIRQHERRRVIYFEFLSAAHVFRENIYTPELVQRRTRLLYAASRYYAEQHADTPGFLHQPPHPCAADEASPLADIIREIYSQGVHARPSNYCFEIPVG
jgi:hypothetical protein